MYCLARVLVVFLVALAAAGPARAQDVPSDSAVASAGVKPQGPRLEYHTAPGCLDEQTFRHAVASYTKKGADPFRDDAPDVVRVALKKIAGGYRGSVQYIPAEGDPWPPQETTGATCSQVFRSMARVASMRAEPVEAPEPPPPPPPADPPKPPPDPIPSHGSRVAPVTFAELRNPPPSPPPPPMDLTITVSSALLLTAGFTANVGPALQLGGGLRYDWFSLDLELRGVFPSTVWAREAVDPSRATVPVAFDLSQLSAQLVPCARFATYFAGCGVVGAYTFVKQDHAGTVFAPGWIVGPRFGVEAPLGERFAVFGFAEALFFPQPNEQRYVLPAPGQTMNRSNALWRSSPVAGFFGAGVLVKFQ